MNSYWLSRSPQAAPEGPFDLQRILSWRDAGDLEAEALVCPDGEERWRSLDAAVREVAFTRSNQDPIVGMMQLQAKKDRRVVLGLSWAAGFVLLAAIGLAFLPLPGIVVWGYYFLAALACVGIAITLAVKGDVWGCVGLVFVTFIGTPFIMFMTRQILSGVLMVGSL